MLVKIYGRSCSAFCDTYKCQIALFSDFSHGISHNSDDKSTKYRQNVTYALK